MVQQRPMVHIPKAFETTAPGRSEQPTPPPPFQLTTCGDRQMPHVCQAALEVEQNVAMSALFVFENLIDGGGVGGGEGVANGQAAIHWLLSPLPPHHLPCRVCSSTVVAMQDCEFSYLACPTGQAFWSAFWHIPPSIGIRLYGLRTAGSCLPRGLGDRGMAPSHESMC